MPTHTPTYDAIVVGARPAGAATALVLARHGHRVLVLDRMKPGSDTLSTHALMRAGVVQLDRFGLLDRIVAANTPPVDRVTFRYADRVVAPVELDRPLYAPRRTVLDPIVAAAAQEAGAEFRYGARVTGLVRDRDGHVTGVRAVDADRRQVVETAAITIGADGRGSIVAREVEALVTRRWHAAEASIYGYFTGVEPDGYEFLYGVGATAGLIPTNDGHNVFVNLDRDRFRDHLRFDLEASFHAVLREVEPAAADRVAAGVRTSPLRGFAGVPGYLRRPHGPGWALVGDAGYFKDPGTAHGLSDALRDAELLADAIHAGLTGTAAMSTALAGYEATRDDLSIAFADVTDRIASLAWTSEELRTLHLRASEAMQHETRFLLGQPPVPTDIRSPVLV
jgi:flavin-dependent dehydrogenase